MIRVGSSQWAKGVQLRRRSVTGTLAVARIHIQLWVQMNFRGGSASVQGSVCGVIAQRSWSLQFGVTDGLMALVGVVC